MLGHTAVLQAYVRYDDDRGRGEETSFKDNKQSLGLTKRSKKCFEAHQMVVLLGGLAHMVRDVFHFNGFLVQNAGGRIVEVVLNQKAPRS